MAYSLKLDELEVESFSTSGNAGISVMESDSDVCTDGPGGCGTHSLDYGTHCDCSGGGPICTKACVDVSQLTSYDQCCG